MWFSMKHIHSLILASIALFGAGAFAEPVSIACYGQDHGLSVYVDTEVKGLTASYEKPGLKLDFISTPSSFGEHVSHTEIERSMNRIHVVAQVISGDAETPIFDSSIDLTLKFNPDMNHYYIDKVELYRLGEKVDTLPFTNTDGCYVQ
jgi:hypothetical protein